MSTTNRASEIFGLIYTLGISAAAIFVKNPAHQTTAGNIVAVLNAELPALRDIINPPSESVATQKTLGTETGSLGSGQATQ